MIIKDSDSDSDSDSEVQQCPRLVKAPQHGRMNCSLLDPPFSYGSRCDYDCNEGFRMLKGAATVTCEHSGRWSQDVPTCHHGFSLNGSTALFCSSSGFWSHRIPTCTVKKCSAAVAPAGGNMVCVDPVEPFSFGSQCDFTCQEGHYLLGNSTISCLASGDWSHPAPSCAAVQCKNLSAPLHGFIHCWDPLGEHSYGSECSVQCEDGFELVGTNLTKCSARGDWSHGLPVCQAKLCQTVTSPSHGFLSCNHPNGPFSFGSTCSITCDEGFRINGTSKVECFSSAMWSADIPTCTGFRLKSAATVTCEHSGPWSQDVSTCHHGFSLNGSTALFCSSSGFWSHRIPTCTVKKCSAAVAPAGGNMVCVDPVEPFSFGSQCDFTCQEGHYLLGNSTISCLASGDWSHPAPSCAAVQCKNLSAPLHGFIHCWDPLGEHSYGSECSVQCEDGFELVGTNLTKCSARGDWSHGLPVCQAKLCQTVTSPSHGFLSCNHPNGPFSFGSTCSITCDEGFRINGTSKVECFSSAMWSADIPTCTGFRLKSAATVTCEHSGPWSQDVSTCHPVQCGNIHRMSSRMSMNCSHPLANFSFGSECIFTCADGFSLNGSTALFCSSSGFWSHQIPTCTGSSLGLMILQYAAYGAACAALALILFGLTDLIIRHLKKGGSAVKADDLWADTVNPTFEL